jgi:hypothetical protein
MSEVVVERRKVHVCSVSYCKRVTITGRKLCRHHSESNRRYAVISRERKRAARESAQAQGCCLATGCIWPTFTGRLCPAHEWEQRYGVAP